MTKIKSRIVAATLSLSLAGCTTDGSVDWQKVETGVLAVGVGALVVGAALLGAQPGYNQPIVTTCNGSRWSTTCVTR